jgi:hypothetical protein
VADVVLATNSLVVIVAVCTSVFTFVFASCRATTSRSHPRRLFVALSPVNLHCAPPASTSILPGGSPSISTPSKLNGSALALRFLNFFFANNANRQVHPNMLLHLLCLHIHLPPL